MSTGICKTPVSGSGYVGLTTNFSKLLPAKDSTVGFSRKTVSGGYRTHCMQVLYFPTILSGKTIQDLCISLFSQFLVGFG